MARFPQAQRDTAAYNCAISGHEANRALHPYDEVRRAAKLQQRLSTQLFTLNINVNNGAMVIVMAVTA